MPLRWAIAGRDLKKLEIIRAELATINPALTDLPIIVADSGDRESLNKLAAQTRVVCTTVGPYAAYGSELVGACVENGADYCDLTGEVQWIRRMIDAHHDAAQTAGVKIVHCCGFDSIPSDLGMLALQQYAVKTHGTAASEVVLSVVKMKGGVSGGTVASLANVLKEARADRSVMKVMLDPYSLNPEGERSGPERRDRMGAFKDPLAGGWTAPFVMGPINARIVRRSNALMGFPYGRDLKYREVIRFGEGIKGAVGSHAFSAGFGALFGALAWGPTRKLFERFVLPAPGTGPTRQAIAKGFFVLRLTGKGQGSDGQDFTVRCTVRGERDPGYGATAKMLAESALCLAFDGDQLPKRAGVLTPASAMGEVLVARLREHAGVTFEAGN